MSGGNITRTGENPENFEIVKIDFGDSNQGQSNSKKTTGNVKKGDQANAKKTTGKLQSRRVSPKNESPVPVGGIFVLLLVLGATIGFAFLAAKGGLAPWLHNAAIGGSVILGIGFTGGTAFMIVDGIGNHKRQKEFQARDLEFYSQNLPTNK